MNPRTKYAILVISSIVVVYTIIGGMLGPVAAQDGAYQHLSTFMEVVNRIRDDYVDEPEMTAAMAGAIRGMVERVDPYGGYLSPAAVQFYEQYDPLRTPGIGVILAKKFDYPVIVATIPGGPADRAGLGTGDTIEGISGESLREHNLVELKQLLSGAAGTTVDLNVIRRSQAAAEVVRLTREVVAVPPVEARTLDGGIGYVRIPVIVEGKADETRRQIETLRGRGAPGIIVDLRNVAGENRDEALKLADLFIGSGALGYIEGQTVERAVTQATAQGPFANLPLTVLINEGTADAAEVFAAAVRDNRRGAVVGVRSFGVGSIQRLLPLEDGSALLLSVAKYYAPNGDELQAEGVAPTEEVSLTPADPLAAPSSAADRDLQLERALEILRESLPAAAA